MKLSIVLGTLNRLSYLIDAIGSLPVAAGSLWYDTETIVVDGGSTDLTLEWLRRHTAIKTIEQGEALGAVAAFNAGFAAARGEYVAAFNDDAVYLNNALELACHYLDTNPTCGQVAIPYREPGGELHTQEMWLGRHRIKVLYANFSVTRRWLGEQVGWWGDYVQYAGDNELSANIWLQGYSVDELPDGEIMHLAAQDSTRRPNDKGGSRRFYEKWQHVDVARLKP